MIPNPVFKVTPLFDAIAGTTH